MHAVSEAHMVSTKQPI